MGGRRDDFVASERGFEDRGRRFEQDLELLHGAWRGELVGGCPKPSTPRPVAGQVPILMGGTADAVIDRVVRWGAGWTAGGSAPDQVAPFAERVRTAWKDAGREGQPRIVALTYFSLGDEVVDDSKAYLLDYYAYLGEWAQGIADGTPRSSEDVRTTVSRFEEAGVDELIFDPTVADLEQVDRLADLVL